MLVELRVGDEVVRISYEEFERWVREGRIPEALPVRFAPLTGASFLPARDLDLYRALRDDVAARVMRRFTLRRFAPLSTALAAACAGLFAAMAASVAAEGVPLSQALVGVPVDALVAWGAKEPGRVLELHEWWRLLSSVLLHAGVLHLLPNVAYIAYVGWNVENVYGTAGTAVILAASAVASSTLSLFGTSVPSVGASGVTFGLFAAAVVFGWRFGPLLPGDARRKFGWAFFPFLAFFLVLGLRSSVVDNWSHVGGCVGGGLAALLLVPRLVEADVEGRARMLRRVRVALGLVSLPVLLAALDGARLGSGLPRLDEEYVDAHAGWSFRVPSYWRVTRDRFGADTFASPTRREAIAYRAVPRPADGGEAAIGQGVLDDVALDPEVEARPGTLEVGRRAVAGRAWTRARVVVSTEDGPWEVERYAHDSGCCRYALTFEHPLADADVYAPLRARVLESFRVFGSGAPAEGLGAESGNVPPR